jgi:TetR/AcrR family transcriptional regulator, regulator of cefoperazone and chloramphenicol sensitivity
VPAVRDSDLTGYARIRNAALEGFARNGVAATSIRDVAQAAGVSAGLVQHHFGTKAVLREAVDEYVVSIALEAFADLGADAAGEAGVLEDIADRITSMVRDHHLALLYVARSAAAGEESALGIFSAFVTIADEQFAALKKAGVLQPDVDMRWASLHVVIINLATVLMEPALNRHLDAPFLDPQQLERWNAASTALIRHGLFASPIRS